MQGNVAAALGLTHRKGPPEIQLGRCSCGWDLVLGTDIESPELRSCGRAIGRVIEYCPVCRKVNRIDPGPPSYLQSQEKEDRIEYAELTGGNIIDRRHRRRAAASTGHVPRALGARAYEPPTLNPKTL
jgi:hypothetical protein